MEKKRLNTIPAGHLIQTAMSWHLAPEPSELASCEITGFQWEPDSNGGKRHLFGEFTGHRRSVKSPIRAWDFGSIRSQPMREVAAPPLPDIHAAPAPLDYETACK